MRTTLQPRTCSYPRGPSHSHRESHTAPHRQIHDKLAPLHMGTLRHKGVSNYHRSCTQRQRQGPGPENRLTDLGEVILSPSTSDTRAYGPGRSHPSIPRPLTREADYECPAQAMLEPRRHSQASPGDGWAVPLSSCPPQQRTWREAGPAQLWPPSWPREGLLPRAILGACEGFLTQRGNSKFCGFQPATPPPACSASLYMGIQGAAPLSQAVSPQAS